MVRPLQQIMEAVSAADRANVTMRLSCGDHLIESLLLTIEVKEFYKSMNI